MDGPSYAVLFNTLALRHPSLPWLCDEMRQDFLRGGIPPGDSRGKIAGKKHPNKRQFGGCRQKGIGIHAGEQTTT